MPVIINGSTGISGTDGTASTPAVQGTDTNTGMFFPAADQIAFAEGGAEVMRIDASGNVGIGTSAPATALHVLGNITSGGNQSGKYLARNGANVHVMDFGIGTGTGFGDSIGLYNLTSTGIISFGTNNAERARITAAGDFHFNSGFGSAGRAFGCRAWVNFNGTGTVAIRASGNVSSITDNGTGDYTVNLTTAMPDANYAATQMIMSNNTNGAGWSANMRNDVAPATGSFRFLTGVQNSLPIDVAQVHVAIFR